MQINVRASVDSSAQTNSVSVTIDGVKAVDVEVNTGEAKAKGQNGNTPLTEPVKETEEEK